MQIQSTKLVTKLMRCSSILYYSFQEDNHLVPGTMKPHTETTQSLSFLRVSINAKLAISDVLPSYQGKLHHLQQYLSQWGQSWDTRHKWKNENIEPGH